MSRDHADIVIIGGGAVGAGVAYALAQAGYHDVLLLEKEPALAGATSSQAAGLVGQVRASVERVKLAKWSVRVFNDLQKHEQASPGWRQVGSLRIAMTEPRVEQFFELKRVCDRAGLETRFITPSQANDMWPLMNFEDAKAVLWCPSDGYIQPHDLTMAYVHHCRAAGHRFETNVTVTDILTQRGCVVGVQTDRGEIRCRTVINAAGAHAYHIARMVGLELPIVPVRHQMFVTVHCPDIQGDYPVMRLPDISLYVRGEVNSLLVGGWEKPSRSADPRGYEHHDIPPAIEPDWDALGGFGEDLSRYMPRLNQMGVRSVFKGWPTFTPDGRFIIGPTRHLRGFIMAGGCNAHGVSGSAGIGRHVAESMSDRVSDYVAGLSPDRFLDQPWQWETVMRQARELYENYYVLDGKSGEVRQTSAPKTGPNEINTSNPPLAQKT